MPNKPTKMKNGYDVTITDEKDALIVRKAAYSVDKVTAIRNVLKLFEAELMDLNSFTISVEEYVYTPTTRKPKPPPKPMIPHDFTYGDEVVFLADHSSAEGDLLASVYTKGMVDLTDSDQERNEVRVRADDRSFWTPVSILKKA